MEADQEFGEKETYLHGPELRTAQSDLHLTCIGVCYFVNRIFKQP